MMLALLLARAGIDVTVMEKHADFLRDFRGDTVHASTLRLLDELGLGAAFATVPHRLIESVNATIQDTPVRVDLTRCPARTNTSPWYRSGISSRCSPVPRPRSRPSG